MLSPPSTSQQTVSCANKYMSANIIINPIPSSYYSSSSAPSFFENGSYGALAPLGAYEWGASRSGEYVRPWVHTEKDRNNPAKILDTCLYGHSSSNINRAIIFNALVPRIYRYIYYDVEYKYDPDYYSSSADLSGLLMFDLYKNKGDRLSFGSVGRAGDIRFYRSSSNQGIFVGDCDLNIDADSNQNTSENVGLTKNTTYTYLMVYISVKCSTKGSVSIKRLYMHN